MELIEPTCNKQPIQLFVTNDPIWAKECLMCCKGGTGFSDFVPTFWAFTANCRGYVWPSEMYLPFVDVSLGAQNIFLAAETFGLSGTILSWAQKNIQENLQLRKLLSIPDDCIIVFCAVIGYPLYRYQIPTRKDIK